MKELEQKSVPIVSSINTVFALFRVARLSLINIKSHWTGKRFTAKRFQSNSYLCRIP